MKLTKPLLAGILSATTVLGAGTLTASAAENSVMSDVRAGFRIADPGEEDMGPENPINPGQPGGPGGPDAEDGPGPGEGTNGRLRIDHVPNFWFGHVDFDPIQGARAYSMPETWVNEDGTYSNIPNFVQVTDLRGTNAGWQLTVAQQGQLRTAEDQELRGAQIIFNGMRATNLDGSVRPHHNLTSRTLDPDGTALSVARALASPDATNIGETMGVGRTILRFLGQDDDNLHGNAILDVPGGVAVQQDVSYSTSLLWTLHNTPNTSFILT